MSVITAAEKAIKESGKYPTHARVVDYIVARQVAALEGDEGLVAEFVILAMECVARDFFEPGDEGWDALYCLGYVDKEDVVE